MVVSKLAGYKILCSPNNCFRICCRIFGELILGLLYTFFKIISIVSCTGTLENKLSTSNGANFFGSSHCLSKEMNSYVFCKVYFWNMLNYYLGRLFRNFIGDGTNLWYYGSQRKIFHKLMKFWIFINIFWVIVSFTFGEF